MILSEHARRRMIERRINEDEVRQALGNVSGETRARTWDRVNVWGTTDAGRMLRITTYRNNRSYVVTVVAPWEGSR
jgi:hypothetical protein